MAMINLEGRITRRGFLECGSAALASAGLVGNGYADSVLKGDTVLDSAKPSSEPLAVRLRWKSILYLPKILNQVTQSETFTLKLNRKSSTLAAGASQIWIAVVSTSVSFR